MNRSIRVGGHVLAGVIVGVVVAACALALTLAMVLLTGEGAELPGVVRAWPAHQNGARAVDFLPNTFGLVLFAVLVAGAYVAFMLSVTRRRPSAPL